MWEYRTTNQINMESMKDFWEEKEEKKTCIYYDFSYST